MDRTMVIAGRLFRQLSRNRRLVGPLLALPLVEIYILKAIIDALASSPGFIVQNYIVPTVAFLVSFITFLLCLLALVRERAEGTLARSFVAGFERADIIRGYAVTYGTVVLFLAGEILGFAIWLFRLSLSPGQVAGIFLVLWFLGVASLALGMFLSNFAESESQTIPMVPGVVLASLFLSGLVVPVRDLAAWARLLAFFVPLRYAVAAVRSIALDGVTMADQLWRLLALGGWAAVFFWLAGRTLPGDAAEEGRGVGWGTYTLSAALLLLAGLLWLAVPHPALVVRDAAVDGQLVPVTAVEPGRLLVWRIRTGERVSRGETLGLLYTDDGRSAVVSAPVTGVVVQSRAVPGMRVWPSKPLLAQLVDPRRLYVTAEVPERAVSLLAVGDLAEVRVDGWPGRVLLGRVEAVVPVTAGRLRGRPAYTANFVREEARIPVRIRLFGGHGYLFLGESAEAAFFRTRNPAGLTRRLF